MNNPYGAAVAGIASVAGASINADASRKRQREAYKQQSKLMKEQNAINVKNWHTQNAYNSDQAQVSRRKAAGLNPVTIDGMSNAGTMAGATAPSVPLGQTADFGAVAQQTLQGMQLDMQRNLSDSQADLNRAEADSLRGDTDPAKTEMDYKRSMTALNEATKNWTDSRTLSESLKRDILSIDKGLRQLDFQAMTSSFTFRTPGGKMVSAPRYMADVLIKAAEVEMSMEASETSRYTKHSARSRARVDSMQANTWMDAFEANMRNIGSQIRDRLGSAEAREFENSMNRSLEDIIRSSRNSELYHKSRYHSNMYHNEKSFRSELGRILKDLSPFSSTSAGFFGK
ncbi:hypothetical protein [uncultured Alistipes sp.]|jgi:hypothetical protein|uniref:hypothetical protein n=1 Tax=uncultured Alistipes sp. TaxID=538949 RepID=UPI0025E8FD57|nr:hypothetical protein [uncultured Alistipes sp.]